MKQGYASNRNKNRTIKESQTHTKIIKTRKKIIFLPESRKEKNSITNP
jgi:hypothetical protein